ncbi:MAG: hypothetical protein B6D65_02800 [candidate division Zixibacteria bacterium 4484_93]|nr:MAG: hypothetical protein B6D65_02800 [candidate division Zixibacteria bacterium 4484_93]
MNNLIKLEGNMKRLAFSLLLIFVLLGSYQMLLAQSYQIVWRVFESGGSEGDIVMSPTGDIRASICIGQPTAVTEEAFVTTGGDYRLYPGFRKIDLDLRDPTSWITAMVRYSCGNSFTVEWAGKDSTAEDGPGWGIWVYDLQYRVGELGVWTEWLDSTTATSATFGPDDPVTVEEGETYYIRIRARDKATNVAEWGEPETTTVNYQVVFSVEVASGGVDLDEDNFIIVSYYLDDPATPVVDTLWSGHPEALCVIPGSEASYTQLSSASGTDERWMAETPPSWVINSTDPISATYYHQIAPVITLDGTDATHTVSTTSRTIFGATSTESGLLGSWSDWVDRSSELAFSRATTGTPPLFAIDDTAWIVSNPFADTIHYMFGEVNVTVEVDFIGGEVITDGMTYPSPYSAIWTTATTHSISVDSIQFVGGDTSVRYVFEGWSDGGERTHNVTPLSDTTFTAHFRVEYELVISNPDGHDTPDPSEGSHYYPDGTGLTCSIADTVYEGDGYRYICTGWTDGYGSVPTATGTDTSVSFTITEPSGLTWNWREELRFTVINPGGRDTPVPAAGDHWYAPGSSISGYITEPHTDGYICVGWTGTGSLGDGFGTEFSFIITEPSSITWNWLPEGTEVVTLTVYSDYGTPAPSVGTHEFPSGTEIFCTVDDSVVSADERHICTGWTGTGSVPSSGTGSTTPTFTMTENSTITWNWQNFYLLTIGSTPDYYDSPEPDTGSYWYEEGTLVSGNVTSPDGDWWCIGYWGTGSATSTPGATSFEFEIYEPSTVTWRWANESESVFLTVISDFGHPEPSGVTAYEVGAEVYATVEDTAYEGTDTRHICTGWTGDGSVPPTGTDNEVTFNIYENSTLTWNWITQFYLTLAYTGTDAVVPEQHGEGWYNQGDTADVSTEPWMEDMGEYYAFNYWTRSTTELSISDSLSPEIEVVMDGAGILTANYASGEDVASVTIERDPAHSTGGIIADGDTLLGASTYVTWWVVGSEHTIGVTSPDSTDTTMYFFSDWSDGGGIIHTVNISTDTTFTAHYTRKYKVVVMKNPSTDTLGWLAIDRITYYGSESAYKIVWIDEGRAIEIVASETDSTDGVRYLFQNWNGTISSPSFLTPAIHSPVAYVANYLKQFHVTIEKDPIEDVYGWIMFDTDTLFDTSSAGFWVEPETEHTVGVSPVDIVGDTLVYHFNNWSDGGAREHSIGPIDTAVSLVAYYYTSVETLEVSLSRNFWYVGDSVEYMTTVVMQDTQVITITSHSSSPVRFGLRIHYIEPPWTTGIDNGPDRFALHAIFNDLPTPPSSGSFHRVLDLVKYSERADFASNIVFGPGGYNILPGTTENLWLEFVSPTTSTAPDWEEMEIIMEMRVRFDF